MKSQRAKLLRAQMVDIHGQKFYDLTFVIDSKPDAPKTSRIGAESVYANPQEGDAIEVGLLLGQLTSVKRADSAN